MKIGIDARFLTHPQHGGFKTYTVNLTRALSEVDHENQYIFYIDRLPAEADALPQAHNFTYKVVPLKFSMASMPYREQVLLRRQITRDELDVVHFLCNTAPIFLPENSVLSLLDVIQVKTPQNFPASTNILNYQRWAITAYSKWTILNTIEKAKSIITLSYYEKGEIEKHLQIDPERIYVTYFGVNPVFTPVGPDAKQALRREMQQKFGIDRRFIMGVGYEPRKNIPLLIESFAKLAPKYQDLDLVVVAAEKVRAAYFRQLVDELNLNDRVMILGSVGPSDLAKLYNLAQVFAFPSERESFGAPPLEAVACGAPTVAMNMTSLPEILADGALLVDGKDPQVWANAIERLLVDENLVSTLKQRGLKRASELTWQQCAIDTIKVYEQIGQKVPGTIW